METAPQKKIKLTKKQRGFVKSYVDSENGSQAIKENYVVKNNKVATVMAVENLANPSIIQAIEVKRKSLKDALIARGITEDYLAEKVDVLLTAVDDKGNDDYTAIDKGLKHATSIYGVVETKGNEGGNTYNFIFNKEVQAEVREIESRIKAQLLQKNDKEN